MILIVNGQERQIEQIVTLQDLLSALRYSGNFFAVAVNKVLVPRALYPSTTVKDRDAIEILTPMQGG